MQGGRAIDIRLHAHVCVRTHTARRLSQKEGREGLKTQEKGWIAIEHCLLDMMWIISKPDTRHGRGQDEGLMRTSSIEAINWLWWG